MLTNSYNLQSLIDRFTTELKTGGYYQNLTEQLDFNIKLRELNQVHDPKLPIGECIYKRNVLLQHDGIARIASQFYEFSLIKRKNESGRLVVVAMEPSSFDDSNIFWHFREAIDSILNDTIYRLNQIKEPEKSDAQINSYEKNIETTLDSSLNVKNLAEMVMIPFRVSDIHVQNSLSALLNSLGYSQSLESYLDTLDEDTGTELRTCIAYLFKQKNESYQLYESFPKGGLIDDTLLNKEVKVGSSNEELIAEILMFHSHFDSYKVPVIDENGEYAYYELMTDLQILPSMTSITGTKVETRRFFKYLFSFLAKRHEAIDDFLSYHFFNSFKASWIDYQGFLEDLLPDFHNQQKLRHWIDNTVFAIHTPPSLPIKFQGIAKYLNGYRQNDHETGKKVNTLERNLRKDLDKTNFSTRGTDYYQSDYWYLINELWVNGLLTKYPIFKIQNNSD